MPPELLRGSWEAAPNIQQPLKILGEVAGIVKRKGFYQPSRVEASEASGGAADEGMTTRPTYHRPRRASYSLIATPLKDPTPMAGEVATRARSPNASMENSET
jgi:hypothetical protein